MSLQLVAILTRFLRMNVIRILVGISFAFWNQEIPSAALAF